MNIPEISSFNKGMENASEDDYFSKVISPLCYAIKAYPFNLLQNIFSEEECITEELSMRKKEDKKRIQSLMMFNPYFNLLCELSNEKAVFRLANLPELPEERKLSLEAQIASRAVELTERYSTHKYYALHRATDDALDAFTEICLRLNPKGHFKEYLKIGIVEALPKDNDYQQGGVQVRLLEGQDPFKAHAEQKKLEERTDELHRKSSEQTEPGAMLTSEMTETRSSLDLLKKMIENITAYSKIRCMLTNSAQEVTPVNTTVAFFPERRGNENNWISTGRLISVFPSDTAPETTDIEGQIRYIDQSRN